MNPKGELIRVINNIYENWMSINKDFKCGERWREGYALNGKLRTDYLDSAFIDELELNLTSDPNWDIKSEVRLRLSKTWSKYDVGCYYNGNLVGLIELAVGDSNVAHALHNGEVKLLGICDGVSVRNNNLNFAFENKLEVDEIKHIQCELNKIPVRGLFYTKGDGLYKPRETRWFTTKFKGYLGETKFHSALFPIGSVEDLNTVFKKLNETGLYTWYL
jgi:hypothetical protein